MLAERLGETLGRLRGAGSRSETREGDQLHAAMNTVCGVLPSRRGVPVFAAGEDMMRRIDRAAALRAVANRRITAAMIEIGTCCVTL